jgi:hypothetical protein
MAGGAFVDSGAGSKEYPGKLTLYVFFTCIVAATGGLIFGYDIGISGKYSLQGRMPIVFFFFLVGNIENSLKYFCGYKYNLWYSAILNAQ